MKQEQESQAWRGRGHRLGGVGLPRGAGKLRRPVLGGLSSGQWETMRIGGWHARLRFQKDPFGHSSGDGLAVPSVRPGREHGLSPGLETQGTAWGRGHTGAEEGHLGRNLRAKIEVPPRQHQYRGECVQDGARCWWRGTEKAAILRQGALQNRHVWCEVF